MRLKYAPDLTFRPDHSFAEAARIEALLAEERAAVGSASTRTMMARSKVRGLPIHGWLCLDKPGA